MHNTMKLKAFLVLGGLLAVTGCSNTVRYVTATQWISTTPSSAGGTSTPEIPAGGAAAPAAPAAAATAPAAATPAAPAAAAPIPASAASTYVLYVAYWEGTCSKSIFSSGCNRGDSKIKRCNVAADNTMTCKDEADANRALAAETK